MLTLNVGIFMGLKNVDCVPAENKGLPVAAVDLLFVLNKAALASFFISSALFILSTSAGTFPAAQSILSNCNSDG